MAIVSLGNDLRYRRLDHAGVGLERPQGPGNAGRLSIEVGAAVLRNRALNC